VFASHPGRSPSGEPSAILEVFSSLPRAAWIPLNSEGCSGKGGSGVALFPNWAGYHNSGNGTGVARCGLRSVASPQGWFVNLLTGGIAWRSRCGRTPWRTTLRPVSTSRRRPSSRVAETGHQKLQPGWLKCKLGHGFANSDKKLVALKVTWLSRLRRAVARPKNGSDSITSSRCRRDFAHMARAEFRPYLSSSFGGNWILCPRSIYWKDGRKSHVTGK